MALAPCLREVCVMKRPRPLDILYFALLLAIGGAIGVMVYFICHPEELMP